MLKMNKRSYKKELIDLGPAFYTEKEYTDCLYQLAKIGVLLGGDRATFKALKKVKEPLSFLDVGCGGGIFTLKLGKAFPKAPVTGSDISKEAFTFAQKRLLETPLKNVSFELSAQPELDYPENSFDVVTSTLVCHHLEDEELINFLKKSYQIAKKAVIFNDLHRHPLAYFGFSVIAYPFFQNRLIFNDGLLSIQRSFTKKEWFHYLKQADIPLEHCSLTWHFPFRWILYIDTSKKESP